MRRAGGSAPARRDSAALSLLSSLSPEAAVQRYPFGVWLGVAFSVSLAVSAVYWDASRLPVNAGSSWNTVVGVNREYRATAENLTLPDGVDWPTETPYPAEFENGGKLSYGSGVGAQWAQSYWFDAWASVATSPAADAIEREAAIRQLPRFLHMDAFKNKEPPHEREAFRKMITDAQAGKLSELQDYIGLKSSPGESGGLDE